MTDERRAAASPQRIGFIGLGVMGAPMTGHLVAAGHALAVPTRSRVPQAIADGAAACRANAREVARRSDAIITMVPDTPDVELTPGKTVVEAAPGIARRW